MRGAVEERTRFSKAPQLRVSGWTNPKEQQSVRESQLDDGLLFKKSTMTSRAGSIAISRKSQAKTSLMIGQINVFLGLGKAFENEKLAIVNPINENLEATSPFSVELFNLAGPAVEEEFQNYKINHREKQKVGHAFITKAGGVGAQLLIHLVCPEYKAGKIEEQKNLGMAIYSL